MPLDVGSVLQGGFQHQKAGRLQEAEASYRQVLAAFPRHAEASYFLGTLAEQVGRPDVAVQLMRVAVEEAPWHPRYVIPLGRLLIKQGGLEEALALFQTATRNYPHHGELHAMLGTALHINGQAQEAATAYQRALALEPNLVYANANLGVLMFLLGRNDEAMTALSRAIALDPAYAEAHGALGYVLIQQGKVAEGVAELRRSVELRPNSPLLLSGLGEGYMQAGDAAAALRLVRDSRARGGDPNAMRAIEYFALHELGEDAAARALVDYDRLTFFETFPVPPGFASLAEFNLALAADMRAHPSLLWEPVGKTTRGGHQTASLLNRPTSLTRVFEQALRKKLDEFIAALPPDPHHPMFCRKPSTYRLNIWSTILETGGHQESHAHAGGWFSGVYYVELPRSLGTTAQDHAGWIELGRPPREYLLRREPRIKTVQPHGGLLLLFPSYLYHRTIPFEGGGQRISIAFDVVG